MQYTPKSRTEIIESKLIPKGKHDIECISAEERPSQAGNDMLVLNWRVYAGEVVKYHTDYIVPGNDMGLEKLYDLCAATGLLDHYNNQTVSAELCVGLTCKALFIHKKKKDSEDLQSELKAYLSAEQASPAPQPTSKAALQQPGDSEDDIPF